MRWFHIQRFSTQRSNMQRASTQQERTLALETETPGFTFLLYYVLAQWFLRVSFSGLVRWEWNMIPVSQVCRKEWSELTHAMCPGLAHSKFPINVVSIIIIIRTFIITVNVLIIIMVFIISEGGSQTGEGSKKPRLLTIKSTTLYHFSHLQAQNLLFWLQEIPANILSTSCIPGPLSGSLNAWFDLNLSWPWALDLNIPILQLWKLRPMEGHCWGHSVREW